MIIERIAIYNRSEKIVLIFCIFNPKHIGHVALGWQNGRLPRRAQRNSGEHSFCLDPEPGRRIVSFFYQKKKKKKIIYKWQ